MSDYDWSNVTAAWHHWHHGPCLSLETPESAAKRIRGINAFKPEAERPERLLRFKPADVSSIPVLVKAYAALVKAYAARVKADAALVKAYAARAKAEAAWVKAHAAWTKAEAALAKVANANLPAIVVLHAQQCGCRWSPEHPSIFDQDHE